MTGMPRGASGAALADEQEFVQHWRLEGSPPRSAQRTTTPAHRSVALANAAAPYVPWLLPWIIIFTVPNPINQYGYLDPFFYTGLIEDPALLVRAFGVTYYSNRVSFTEVARLFHTLFGTEYGYLLARVFFLTLTCVSAYAIARTLFSRTTAAACALLVGLNPLFVGPLLWDHMDGPATSYIMAALACLTAVAPRRPVLGHLAFGLFTAAAVNTNLFSLAVLGAFGPAWLAARWRKNLLASLGLLAAMAAGLAAGYLAVLLVQYLRYPEAGFLQELVTLRAATGLAGGGAAAWFATIGASLAVGRHYLLFPLMLIPAILLLLAFHRDETGRTGLVVQARLYLLALIAVYLIAHQRKIGFFILPYYFDYFAPAFYLLTLSVLAASPSARSESSSVWLWLAVLALAVCWAAYPLFEPWYNGPTSRVISYAALGVAAATLLLSATRWPALRSAGAGAFCCALPVLFHSGAAMNDYGRMLSTTPRLVAGVPNRVVEGDAYQGAVWLVRGVRSRLGSDIAAVRFWYPDKDLFITMAQSALLFGYSRAHPYSETAPGLPELDAATLDTLRGSRAAVLLARDADAVSRGLEALAAAGLNMADAGRARFQGKALAYEAAFVRFLPVIKPLGATVLQLQPDQLETVHGASFAIEDGAPTFTTAAPVWAYSVPARLDDRALPAEPLVLRVRYRVLQGKVGFGLLTPDDRFLIELSGVPTEEGEESVVDLPFTGGEAERFMVRNWSETGPSRVVITSIEVAKAP